MTADRGAGDLGSASRGRLWTGVVDARSMARTGGGTSAVSPCLRLMLIAFAVSSAVAAQERVPPAESGTAASAMTLSREAKEAFLGSARVVSTRPAGGGITGSLRVTLSDGTRTHDAHVQTIDQQRDRFRTRRGVERNFRDSWRYNVAAYRLAVLLDLEMVPVSVERAFRQRLASFTWWVDDVMMDEAARLKQDLRAPDPVAWTRQIYVMRVFDQLIDNSDRNMGNLLITSNWDLWLIDHTRAFRHQPTLRNVEVLRGCDRTLLARLEALDRAAVTHALSRWLDVVEIDALLARRDAIVEHFRAASTSTLFDLPRRAGAEP